MRLVFVVLALFLVGCSKSYLPGPEETEAALATTEALERRFGLVSERDVNLLLRRINRRLARAVYGTALDYEIKDVPASVFANFPWQIYVLDTEEPNAFSPGAGIILLTRGLISTAPSEAALAAVISHEMAHIVLGHTGDAIKRSGLSTDHPKFSFSLRDELAADALGLKILKVARYDIRHAKHALSIPYRRSGAEVSGIPPEWLSLRMTHLHRGIDNAGRFLPATQNTREFTRVRSRLRNRRS